MSRARTLRRLGPPRRAGQPGRKQFARRPWALPTLSAILLALALPLAGLPAGCGPRPGVSPGAPAGLEPLPPAYQPPVASAPQPQPGPTDNIPGPSLSPAAIRSMTSILRRAAAQRLPAVQGEELYTPDFAAARLAAAQGRVAEALSAAAATQPEYAPVARDMQQALQAAEKALQAGNLAQSLELANRAQTLAASLLARRGEGAGVPATPGVSGSPGDPAHRLEEVDAAWAEREAGLQDLEAQPLSAPAYLVLTVLEYLADSTQRQLEHCRALSARLPASGPGATASLASGLESTALAMDLFDHLCLRLDELDRQSRVPGRPGLGRALLGKAHAALDQALSRARIAPSLPIAGVDPLAALQTATLESERHLRMAESLAGLAAEPGPGREALAWLRACEALQEVWALDRARALEGTAGVALAQTAADTRRGFIADLRRALDRAGELERRGLPAAWAVTRMKEGLELAAEGDRVLAETLQGSRSPELGARDAGLVYLRAQAVERLVAGVLEAVMEAVEGS